jgi:anti-anti-sigma factor
MAPGQNRGAADAGKRREKQQCWGEWMAVHALTEVGVAPGRAREAIWSAARLGRRLGEQPGFQGLRVFRSETDAGALIVLTEWAGWDAAAAAEESAPIAALLARTRAACTRWTDRRLEPLFHVQLPRRPGRAGLGQAMHVGSLCPTEGIARQKEFGLKVMTLPGSVGVIGGRCAQDPSYYFCVVEFDSTDALSDFIASPTRMEWTRLGAATWWHQEPRLEVPGQVHAARPEESEPHAEYLGTLSVRVESAVDGSAVTLRLCGRMDDAAAERFLRVRDAIVAHGCRELTLDVSDLTSASSQGLQTLLSTARRVKDAGGRFTLADNQGRFNRILRVLHLNRALSLGENDPPPKRRAARLPIETRWTV